MRRLREPQSLTKKGFDKNETAIDFSHSSLEITKSSGYIQSRSGAQRSMFFENLIGKKQLAEKLSFSLSYIDKLMAQDGLPHFKIGRAVRYRFSEVVTFLERRKRA